jgi:hypothetical protein
VLSYYSLSYDGLMAIPIKTFWLLNQNIDRIEAQKDRRSLSVAVCGQGGAEAASSLHERLVIESGEVVKLKFDPVRDAERDQDGFNALKELA